MQLLPRFVFREFLSIEVKMLQTVRDTCHFDATAIDYALSDQIENLEDLIGHDFAKAKTFFDKTYVTGGMKTLLRQGLQRLGGKSGQAVFELKQAMGGGKTHSMLALGYLAANPGLYGRVPNEVVGGIDPVTAKVVAISGRAISRDKHLWGDIAEQLGRPDLFVDFYKGTPIAPNEKDWITLIGKEPTLILLDELPPYFRNAITHTIGQGTLADVTTFAISNLLSAALKLQNLCIVISNLSGSYDGATKEITALVQKATNDLQQEAGRQAKGITPVELGSDEIYHILRKRLLTETVDASIVDDVATAYSNAISDAVKSKAVAKTANQIADEIVASYPFHPSFKHILALFKDNERFRQTRGLMTLAAMMVRSVQNRTRNDVYLIGCQHIDLTASDIRDSISGIYDLSGAIAHDIAGTGTERGHAQVIDDQTKSDGATQIASLLLMASLPEATGAVKGLTKAQVVENLVAPMRSALEFDEAFENLRGGCWYLHRRENDAWYFDRNENLQKKIENYAKGAAQPKIDQEMKRRLERVFAPTKKTAYSRLVALPKVEEIETSGDRLLIVLSPDRKVPPEDAARLFAAKPEKNNFGIVTGDGSDLAKLEDCVRRVWAIAKVREEDGGDKSSNIIELNEEAEAAEFDFNTTLTTLFNRIFYPGRDPKTGDGLRYVALKIQPTPGKDGKPGTIDGETAIIEALTSTGASKLEIEVNDANVDRLRSRVEDLLWVSGSDERKARWGDIEEQALANVRWIWLPPKGLMELRKRAIATGDWRDNGDGFIEKGPFPPPRTSVRYCERERDAGGKVTLELSAIDAGDRAEIHYASTDDVSEASPVVSDTIFETEETVLWFIAVDPDGKCPTGPATKWCNTLSLTYEPKEVMGKRVVTLDVKPRGTIRWNLEGTTPREGQIYTGPITIPGDGEVTIYVYAEDSGISITKEWHVHATTGGKAKIDPKKPAVVPKKVRLVRVEDVFAVTKAGKATKATFSGINIVVGTGAQSATTRFGISTVLTAAAIEAFIISARAAIGSETAGVEIMFSDFRFESGQSLEEFLEQVSGIVAFDPSEVDQSEVTTSE